MRLIPRLIHWILLTLFAAVLFGLQPAQNASAGRAAVPTILVDQQDSAGRAWLSKVGARQLSEYGAFSLWELPADKAARAAFEQPQIRRTGTRIPLRGLSIDTALPTPEPLLPAGLRSVDIAPQTSRLWMVQFAGPLQNAWLERLRGAGQTVAACLPEYACILWGPDASVPLQQLGKLVRWNGPFQPAYRLHPALRPGGELRMAAGAGALEVTLQFLNVPEAAADLAILKTLAVSTSAQPHAVLNLLNLRASVRSADLDRLAALPTLYNLEPYSAPAKQDEMQTQILAGQLGSTPGLLTASGPGYLNWLAIRNFSSDPNQYPIVDIVDDGIDNGTSTPLHPDFYAYPPTQPRFSRIAFQHSCVANTPPNGIDGHGNLNAGIMAGYNGPGSPQPYLDAAGYALGLGVSPYGRIAGTKIFGPKGYDISTCGTYTGIVSDAYGAGARITSNSWGDSRYNYYDSAAQEYDALTRDASPSNPGDQQMLHIFSAGNNGSGSSTVSSPGTAKNVLTVGATELPRDVGIFDGCGQPSSTSAANIASYSSRGPTGDGRAKPELVAPGTHIQGPASQDPAYATSSTPLCGGASPNKYYYPYPPTIPTQQTLYTLSDGTSHAAPAVAGAAQLAWERYMDLFGRSSPPNPAMLKALLLNTPRYLNGKDSGDILPSMNQGWGMPDLNTAFDATPRFLLDQSHIFTASGETYMVSGSIPDPSKPFHVTLVWTDAPGATVGGAAIVNDLDLQVTVGGVTYLGNVFNGANSSAGGSADALNNVENVFLPAGSATSFSVRVVAHNIAGDGVPERSGATDQDFALVIYNAQVQPAPILSFLSYTWLEDPNASNLNGMIDPGEKANITVSVTNLSDAIDAIAPKDKTDIQGRLQLLSNQGNVVSAQPVGYGVIQKSANGTNDTPFKVQIQSSISCSSPIVSSLHLDYSYILTPPTISTGSIDLPLPPYTFLCKHMDIFMYFPWLSK